MQPQNFHPAGERVREFRNEEHIRRTGEDEAACCAVAVHGPLDGSEERGNALHLIEDHTPWKIGNEAGRVAFGGSSHDLIVECEVFVTAWSADRPGQSRLAGLSRPVDEHHRRVGE